MPLPEIRERRLARGRCGQCGGEKSDSTFKNCERCRAKGLRRVTARAKKLREEGVCFRCGDPNVITGALGARRMCQLCQDKGTVAARKRWERQREEGLPEGYKMHKKRWTARKVIEYRLACFDVYGSACSRCGYDDKEALQLHHTEGLKDEDYRNPDKNGRRKRKTGPTYYRQLSMNKRDDIVVLCANCHVKIHALTIDD